MKSYNSIRRDIEERKEERTNYLSQIRDESASARLEN